MEEKKPSLGGVGSYPPSAVSFGSLTVSPWSSTPYSDAVSRKRRRPAQEEDNDGPDAKGSTAAAAATGRIKRPMNAFMVWSQTERRRLSAENPGLHNVEISRRLGQKWLQMKEEERLPFMEEAERLRLLHIRQYPEYRYVPRKKGSARNNTPLHGKAEEKRKPPATEETGGVPRGHHHHRRLQSTFGEGREWTTVDSDRSSLMRFYEPEKSGGQDRGDSLWLTNDCRAPVSLAESWLNESTHHQSNNNDISPFVFCPPPPSKSHGTSLPPPPPPQWSTDERVSGNGVPLSPPHLPPHLPPLPHLAPEEVIVWSNGHRSISRSSSSRGPVAPVLHHRANGPALLWSRPIWSGDHFVPDAPSPQHCWSSQYPLSNSCYPSSVAATGAQSDWVSPAPGVSGPLPPSSDCYLSSVAQGSLLAAEAVGFLADLSGDFDGDLREEEEDEEDDDDDDEDQASIHSSSSDPFVTWLVDYYDLKQIESSAA